MKKLVNGLGGMVPFLCTIVLLGLTIRDLYERRYNMVLYDSICLLICALTNLKASIKINSMNNELRRKRLALEKEIESLQYTIIRQKEIASGPVHPTYRETLHREINSKIEKINNLKNKLKELET